MKLIKFNTMSNSVISRLFIIAALVVAVGLGASAATLPIVEYIESDGAQFIDAGFVPDGNTTLELKLRAPTASANYHLYGVRDGWLVKSYANFKLPSNKVRPYIGTVQSEDLTVGNGPDYVMRQAPGTFACDGTVLKSGLPTDFSCSTTLALLALHRNNASDYAEIAPSGSRIYYAKIWDGATLVRDLVPYVSDEGCGLYDLVNKRFYPSAATTGAFTAGAFTGYRIGSSGEPEPVPSSYGFVLSVL